MRPRGVSREALIAGKLIHFSSGLDVNSLLMFVVRFWSVSQWSGDSYGRGRAPEEVTLPGMGRIPAHCTMFPEDLVSFGYLVAGVTPTGSSRPVVFPDGHVPADPREC